jgi:hypothetical protein
MWRKETARYLGPLPGVPGVPDYLPGPDPCTDLQRALAIKVGVVEEVALLDRSHGIGGLYHHRVAAQRVPTVPIGPGDRYDGAVG